MSIVWTDIINNKKNDNHAECWGILQIDAACTVLCAVRSTYT